MRWNLTSAQEAGRRKVGMDGLELVAGVLSFCAQQDATAGRFLSTVKVLKTLLETHDGPEPKQPEDPPSWWLNSRLIRPSEFASRGGPFGAVADSDLTSVTPSSIFGRPTYSSTSSFSASSLHHVQHGFAYPGEQINTYPSPFDWTPLRTVRQEPSLNSGNFPYHGSSNSIRQHYQNFLPYFYHLEEDT